LNKSWILSQDLLRFVPLHLGNHFVYWFPNLGVGNSTSPGPWFLAWFTSLSCGILETKMGKKFRQFADAFPSRFAIACNVVQTP
jgi:hypothetical protein